MHIKNLVTKHKLIKKQKVNVATYKRIMSKFCRDRSDFFPLVPYFEGISRIPTIKKMKKRCVVLIFMDIDTDGNGTLDKNEFFAAMKRFRVTDNRTKCDKLFNSIDTDKNGTLDFNELYSALLSGLKAK